MTRKDRIVPRRIIKKLSSDNILRVFNISFIIAFNVMFAIFVWSSYDLSPNFAIGLTSIVIIILNIYKMVETEKLMKYLYRRHK